MKKYLEKARSKNLKSCFERFFVLPGYFDVYFITIH